MRSASRKAHAGSRDSLQLAKTDVTCLRWAFEVNVSDDHTVPEHSDMAH